MDNYQDMRVFCMNNGGIRAQRVQDELVLRRSGDWALQFPFKIKGYPAFVVLCKELQAEIASINRKNLELSLLSSRLPENAIDQFAVHSMIEEIQQTNEFENVQSTRREIREAVEDLHEKRSNKRFLGMVRKYDLLISHKEIPLRSSSDVRRLYDEFILDEVVREKPGNAPDGTIFRKDHNYVNKGERVIHEGLYPEQKIIETMDSALMMLNDSSIDPLIRIAAFHYAFGYIHPFYDGNGRMTRFISSYMLAQAHYAESACLRIAYVIKDHRQAYQRIFGNANDERSMGDLTRFVIGFLRFFEQAIDDAYTSLKEKNDSYVHYSSLLTRFVQCHDKELGKYQKLLTSLLEAGMFGEALLDRNQLAHASTLSVNTVRKVLELCGKLVICKTDGRKYRYAIDLDYLDQAAEIDSGVPKTP